MNLELLNDPFVWRSFKIAIPIAMLSGMIGTLILAKRLIYISGSISHAIFGGIALGLLLETRLSYHHSLIHYPFPLIGAFLVAISCAIFISLLKGQPSEKQDVLLSLLWALGIAGGIIFLSKSKSFTSDLSVLLFGDLFLVTRRDAMLIIVMLLFTALFIITYYRKIQITFLDETYALLKNIPVKRIYFISLLLTACSIVTLVQSIGVTLVIALFSLGASTARLLTKTLVSMIVVSMMLNALYLILGIGVSVMLDIPAAPAVIIVAAIFYILGEGFHALR